MKQGIFYYNNLPQFINQCLLFRSLNVYYPIPALKVFEEHRRVNALRSSMEVQDEENDSPVLRLIECGFEESQARKALSTSGNNFDVSLALLHIECIGEQVSKEYGVSESNVKQIIGLGFSREQALQALKLKVIFQNKYYIFFFITFNFKNLIKYFLE